MLLRTLPFFSLITIFLTTFSYEAICALKYKNQLNTCTPNKSYLNDYEPEVFPKSNNLLRTPGNLPVYQGQKIILYGRLLDTNCVPLDNAAIQIWQADSNGKYPYKILRSRFTRKLPAHPTSTFQGAGTAITDNQGIFTFITLYPLSTGYINLRATQGDRVLQTKVYLAATAKCSQSLLVTDIPQLNSVSDAQASSYCFDIVLPTKNKYKTF